MLDCFLERLKLLNGSVATAVEPHEAPDFICYFEGRRIGIEIYGLYRPPPETGRPRQEQESLRGQVRQRAERYYRRGGGPSEVHVSLLFDSNVLLQKRTVERVARQVAEWAVRHVPTPNGSYEERSDWQNRNEFPQELSILRITRLGGLPHPHFVVLEADYIPDLSVADLQRCIDAKSTNYPNYQARSDEVWLLVVTNTARLSMNFTVPDSTLAAIYHGRFSRAFLLECWPRRLSQLRIVPTESQTAGETGS